jgi:hypothetical protein
MLSRSAPFALLAVLLVPVTGTAPITLKYKISQHYSQIVDLTALGQDPQTNAADYDVYTTVVSQDSAGGHAVSVTVDSVVPAANADPQVAAALTSSLKGAAGAGFVAADGEVSGFTGDAKGTALKGLAQAVYPKIRMGTKPGDKWADTSSAVDSVPGGAMTRNTVTNYTSAAGDSWKGEPTLKVQAAASYTVNGSQTGLTVSGNGTINGTFTVSRAGHTVSGQNSGKASVTASGAQAPMPIPIENETSSTITLLP